MGEKERNTVLAAAFPTSMYGVEQTALNALKVQYPNMEWKYVSGSHLVVRIPTEPGSHTYIELHTYYNSNLVPRKDEETWYDRDDEPVAG